MQDDISSSERVSPKRDILNSYEEAPYDLYNITEEEFVYDRFLASHYHKLNMIWFFRWQVIFDPKVLVASS